MKSRRLGKALWNILFFVTLVFIAPFASAQVLYSNSGNNTTGFVDKFSTGSMVSNGTDIVESTGGTWDTLPITLTGNFQISFDVENISYDGDMHIFLLDTTDNGGIDIRNSPQKTDTPSINIISGSDFTNFNQVFLPDSSNFLASAASTNFPNLTWTHVTISRVGNLLIDDVGGQSISTLNSGLSNTIRVALGGYATSTYDPNPMTNPPLVGEVLFNDLVISVPEPPSMLLMGVGLLFGIAVLIWQRKGMGADGSNGCVPVRESESALFWRF